MVGILAFLAMIVRATIHSICAPLQSRGQASQILRSGNDFLSFLFVFLCGAFLATEVKGVVLRFCEQGKQQLKSLLDHFRRPTKQRTTFASLPVREGSVCVDDLSQSSVVALPVASSSKTIHDVVVVVVAFKVVVVLLLALWWWSSSSRCFPDAARNLPLPPLCRMFAGCLGDDEWCSGRTNFETSSCGDTSWEWIYV